MITWAPLFSLSRGGFEEVCVHGALAVVDAGQSLYATGGVLPRLPARSLAKPFQFLATLAGAAPAELDERLTAALGSISATGAQLAALERWYDGDALEAELVLPGAAPMDLVERARRAAEAPARRCHPCFSKHMAILRACGERGWPTRGYHETEHPFHAELLGVLSRLLGRPAATFDVVADGCRLPTPILGLGELARLYRWLAAADDPASVRLRQAMQRHPTWIGGEGRVDTRLMEVNPGRVIAKEGADGLLAVGIAPSAQAPAGVGMVVKLAAGHQPDWAALALAPFLRAYGAAALEVATPGQDVTWHATPSQSDARPIDISPTLEPAIAVWPGDVGFQRSLTSAMGQPGAGTSAPWELLVSSIQTTVHVGAHADAPNHFSPGGVGIDRVALEPYRGPCQVLALEKPRGSLITADDLWPLVHGDGVLRAPRVLFKTGSFPDARAFNADFVAFAPDAVAWLRERGAVLVGIDTPSVDPFDSKALPAHHATRQGPGLAILEGLVLCDVEPGFYELVALPLRIRDADASPVRAVLWPLR